MTDTRLVAMPTTRLPAWLHRTMAEYVESRMQAGESREQAEANEQQSRDRWFPGGSPADGHLVWEVLDQDDTVVGSLWIGPFTTGSTDWWVFDVEIDEAHRRRGHARRALELGHRAAAERGATSIGLNVFGYNTGAQELYAALGYQVTSAQMRKPLR
ncbi:GNAT family N-acetyltransferase [Curtobacterium flaccumfaciens pv. flaccumfaciens]|uniref:GNAT family N-acetyltransferase n=1 Tax=Curtobacterium flaccumfaciens pv. flaccumfaciens TaxID=138532 RepID=A0A9Q2W0V4_9MICO|nr:GNAT family N-acetyltransferase [Curtobacterium flaccumfaciens]MBT1540417.1 GNAT family N-acetyltransferase [Curtobacterium flaccumfaciens pv. flaccumfaciens]